MSWFAALVLAAAGFQCSHGSYCEWHVDYYFRRSFNYTDDPWSFSIDPSCTSLSCMTMLWGSIDDKGAAALAAAMGNAPQLEELTLGYNNIGDAGATAIATALKHAPRLRLLFFGWNSIGNAGVSALAAAFEHVPQLEELNFFWNFIGEAGTVALAAAMKHTPHLKKLNLAWNNMGDAGAVALAQALQNTPQLAELSVAWSGVGNSGAKALATALVHLPKLKELRMRGNDFGDVGATALAEAIVDLEASRKGEKIISSGIPYAIMESVRNPSSGTSNHATVAPSVGTSHWKEHTHAQQLSAEVVTCNQRKCHAFVVGNVNYKDEAQLPTIVHKDVNDMAATLERLGFVVSKLLDGSKKEMRAAAKTFFKKIEPDGIALVYFAGHSLQQDGINYFLPSDYSAQPTEMLNKSAMSMNWLLRTLGLQRTMVNILIVDACRPSPFQTGFEGLAPAVAPWKTIVAFAAAPGSVCRLETVETGKEQAVEARSLYTGHLLSQLDVSDLHIEQVFKRVRRLVAQESGDKQIPWEGSSLAADFVFNPTARSEL